MLINTSGAATDVVSSLVHFLYDQSKEDLGQQLHYLDWGFSDVDLLLPDAQLAGLSAPGIATITVEGQHYGSNALYRDYPKGFTLRKYTSELEETEEALHWLVRRMRLGDTTAENELRSFVAGNIISLNNAMNLDVAKMFFLGDGTTFFTGGDLLSLFNAAHTIRKSGTQSNLLTDTGLAGGTPLVLSAENIIEALVRMNRYQGMNGQQMGRVRRARVLVSVEKEGEIQKILHSTFGPNNPNLGINIASAEALRSRPRRSVAIDYAVIEDMPNAHSKKWFVVDLDRAQNRTKVGYGWKPRINEKDKFEKGSFLNEGSVFGGPTCLGWQWAAGAFVV